MYPNCKICVSSNVYPLYIKLTPLIPFDSKSKWRITEPSKTLSDVVSVRGFLIFVSGFLLASGNLTLIRIYTLKVVISANCAPFRERNFPMYSQSGLKIYRRQRWNGKIRKSFLVKKNYAGLPVRLIHAQKWEIFCSFLLEMKMNSVLL